MTFLEWNTGENFIKRSKLEEIFKKGHDLKNISQKTHSGHASCFTFIIENFSEIFQTFLEKIKN